MSDLVFWGKNAYICSHYPVEFEWAWPNTVMESEWDMVWHFNYFTRWVLFQELVNVRIYIKWFFFFSPWIWIKTTRKIITAVSHWNSRANACKHLLLHCVYRTKYHCDVLTAFLGCLHPTRQLRVECCMMKNSSVQWKKTALFFSSYCVLSHSHWETFTPLLSASVLTAKGRRSFLFNFF